MTTPPTAAHDRTPASRARIWLGVVFLLLGLIGHLYAAHAIGGSRVAYTHHVLGFLLILVVTGGIIALAGRRFWRFHPDVTVLAIGVVQALLGLLVAIDSVGGG